MDFSFALRHVKKGKKIKREGWNGKDQFVTLGINFSYLDKSSDCIVNPEHKDIGSSALVFHGTSGEQVGWVASQSDMLANDWVLVD